MQEAYRTQQEGAADQGTSPHPGLWQGICTSAAPSGGGPTCPGGCQGWGDTWYGRQGGTGLTWCRG